MSERKVEWVRKLNDTYIYPAVEQMLKRSDMYPCDVNGNLFSTGTQDAPVPLEPIAPKKSETDDSDNAAENKEMLDLIARAKELGLKSATRMKKETLINKINAAEAKAKDSEQ